MAPSKVPASNDINEFKFTPTELRLIVGVLKGRSSAPTFNNEEVASLLGYNNPRSVTNAWTSLLKKIDQVDIGTGHKQALTTSKSSQAKATKTTNGSKKRQESPVEKNTGRSKKVKTESEATSSTGQTGTGTGINNRNHKKLNIPIPPVTPQMSPITGQFERNHTPDTNESTNSRDPHVNSADAEAELV